MRSEIRGLLEMAVIGHCVYNPLFYSDILISFLYAMMLLIYLHSQNNQSGGVGSWGLGEVIVKISCFCEYYNCLLFHFITHCYLILAFTPVGIVYIPVKKFFCFDP